MSGPGVASPVLLGIPTVRREHDLADDLPAATRGLPDPFGRVATDLRVSLTDRCNLRCTYCMPAEGLNWLPTQAVLTDEEVLRLVTIGVRDLGVRTVRFTGGEPLLRKGLERIVAGTAALTTWDGERPDIALTTNGLGLDHRIDGLVAAGLGRLNVSLDSVDPARFAASTRRDRLPDVLTSLRAVDRSGIGPVKINAVPQPTTYRQDAPELLRFCLERGYQLRFIEFMPIGPPETWNRAEVITAQDLRDALTDAGFTLTARRGPRGSAPAKVEDVSHHRLRVRAVLRHLHAHAPHGRRRDPFLPVLDHRDIPARRDAHGRRRRDSEAHLAGRHVGQAEGPRLHDRRLLRHTITDDVRHRRLT
jgi:cyclic pyranopterin phosphate synthase